MSKDTQTQLARLPVVSNSEYVCIREALEACLVTLVEGPDSAFVMAFFLSELPVFKFYVQAKRINAHGKISIEALRVTDTEPLVLSAKDAKAKIFGWKNPSNCEDCRNYSQVVNLEKVSARRIADELVEAIQHLGGVSPDAWVTIEPSSFRKELESTALFWTMRNDNQYLCQRGYNIVRTVQGNSVFTNS